mmetsp:Transcript_34052/g.25134  ORF Transcript_34052/g.25134 Transcript_34052/m.25134 type:complete len:218 (+) Transcript_34052:277-930(+)
MEDAINLTCWVNTVLGAFVAVASYLYYSTLLVFSENVSHKIRIKYLQAILQQDCPWYDLTNPAELSSRLRKEVYAISTGIGEKTGTIIFAFGMVVAGFAFAFIRGWSYSLCVLGAFPLVIIPTQAMTQIQQGGFIQSMKAYGQSAGYAEQALSAIRVVVAFGQESTEMLNYEAYLGKAKKQGVALSLKSSMILGVFMWASLSCYAYAYFFGSIWIYN